MSSIDLYSQWMTVLLMLLSGLTMGVAYDSYRVVAGQLHFPRWTLPCIDIIYWLAATWFVFQMLVKGNQGELRFYVFLGLALGAWLYYILLSKLTVMIVNGIVIAVKVVVKFLLQTLYFVLILPLKTIGLFLLAILRFLGAVAIFLGKVVLKCSQPLWWLVRWLFSPLVMPLWNRFGMTERVIRWWASMKRVAGAVSRAIKRGTRTCANLPATIRSWLRIKHK
ncbi:spore cortex biosynthesis protein YabQ [Paenibacillus taiwanensis]|uniref:spore cortex biosynthesis protein YabQ n=1 Tax=Paenibacillus taiwanensis TaxID=401638 RepID=UPI001FE008CD|nr:spore cortex biosynthesis protein YabQ [Paenibacillus taiwanensis]